MTASAASRVYDHPGEERTHMTTRCLPAVLFGAAMFAIALGLVRVPERRAVSRETPLRS